VFIEYETAEQAEKAIKTHDGQSLDKTHKLRVNRFTGVEKYANASETYVEPKIDPYVKKVFHLCSILMEGTLEKLAQGSPSKRSILHLSRYRVDRLLQPKKRGARTSQGPTNRILLYSAILT
jgi:hypothetical protein